MTRDASAVEMEALPEKDEIPEEEDLSALADVLEELPEEELLAEESPLVESEEDRIARETAEAEEAERLLKERIEAEVAARLAQERSKAEEEAARLQAEAEAKTQAEAEARRLAEEYARLQAEEQAKAEAEAHRLAEEEAARLRYYIRDIAPSTLADNTHKFPKSSCIGGVFHKRAVTNFHVQYNVFCPACYFFTHYRCGNQRNTVNSPRRIAYRVKHLISRC